MVHQPIGPLPPQFLFLRSYQRDWNSQQGYLYDQHALSWRLARIRLAASKSHRCLNLLFIFYFLLFSIFLKVDLIQFVIFIYIIFFHMLLCIIFFHMLLLSIICWDTVYILVFSFLIQNYLHFLLNFRYKFRINIKVNFANFHLTLNTKYFFYIFLHILVIRNSSCLRIRFNIFLILI